MIETDLLTLRWPSRPFHVVANPPWSGAVDLLRQLTGPRSALITGRLVLPAGLVHQAEERRRGMGRRFAGRWVGDVPPYAFHPAPPGPAAVLDLRR